MVIFTIYYRTFYKNYYTKYMDQKSKSWIERDRLSFLGQSFSLEFPFTSKECIERIESVLDTQPLRKSKNQLEIAAIDDTSYLFSFEGMGLLQSLLYKGIIEQLSAHKTEINGIARISDTAVLKNALMIILTIIFINFKYLNLIFLFNTVLSIYFDIRLSRNAVQKFKNIMLSHGEE
jgi:hypothetical protein